MCHMTLQFEDQLVHVMRASQSVILPKSIEKGIVKTNRKEISICANVACFGLRFKQKG